MTTFALLLTFGRSLFGLVLLLRPAVVARAWIGVEAASRPEAEMLLRAVGARDMAIGLGGFLALLRGRPARGWLEAGVLADVGDVALNALYINRLPSRGALSTIAIAGLSAAVGWRAASALEHGSEETLPAVSPN